MRWLPFLLSVQFHPERLVDRYPEHRAIFGAFTRAVCAIAEKSMKAKILVVDDDSGIRGLLAEVLASNEYKVTRSENAAAVQKALTGEQPDVVVLDVKLGQDKEDERAGLDLLPQIKKHWPETEVIMLTGQGTFEMAIEASRRGAYNFLSKPFETGNCSSTSNALSNARSRTRKTAPCAARSKP